MIVLWSQSSIDEHNLFIFQFNILKSFLKQPNILKINGDIVGNSCNLCLFSNVFVILFLGEIKTNTIQVTCGIQGSCGCTCNIPNTILLRDHSVRDKKCVVVCYIWKVGLNECQLEWECAYYVSSWNNSFSINCLDCKCDRHTEWTWCRVGGQSNITLQMWWCSRYIKDLRGGTTYRKYPIVVINVIFLLVEHKELLH